MDPLSFVLRYVKQSRKPVERYLKFLPKDGDIAFDMFTAVTDTMKCMNWSAMGDLTTTRQTYLGFTLIYNQEFLKPVYLHHMFLEEWSTVINALEELESDSDQKTGVRAESRGLIKISMQLDTAVLAELWGTILLRLYNVVKYVQNEDDDVTVVVEVWKKVAMNDVCRDRCSLHLLY
ncbi:hypothetical protein J6590_023771 [Homalodisca vitripennis]|nr:hypothetical protein J6590_023771 [Homalodisca vitripennis]